jgi:hypothetical protein
MSKAGMSFLLTLIVAGVIIGDLALGAPWRYVVWGVGMSLPWVVVTRLLPRQLT